MSFGKKSSLFFINADVHGTMVCEMSDWSGRVYRIPTKALKNYNNCRDLKFSGIFMLLGRNERQEKIAFIGVEDDIFNSVSIQLNIESFWQEVIVIIYKEENFYKKHKQYIIDKLHIHVLGGNQYVLLNDTIPHIISVSERVTLDEFIVKIKMIVNILRYKLLKDNKGGNIPKIGNGIWTLQTVGNKSAKGILTEDGFVLLKGSIICSDVAPSFPESLFAKRDSLIYTGKLQYIKWLNAFMAKGDIPFSNPTEAAIITLGRMAIGELEWKNIFGWPLIEEII